MIRILIGSILGGLLQFLVGFVFWGTPLAGIALSSVGDAPNATVQAVLAQNLPTTGTYFVPMPDTAQSAILHGRGPVALIFFNTHGFPQMMPSAMIGGLILSIVSMLLIGLALHTVAARVDDFASRAKIVIFAAIGIVGYAIIGQPIYNFFMPWGYWIYLAISLLVGFIAGGLVLARWFVPFAAPRTAVAADTTVH
jgi:hypothetical protein